MAMDPLAERRRQGQTKVWDKIDRAQFFLEQARGARETQLRMTWCMEIAAESLYAAAVIFNECVAPATEQKLGTKKAAGRASAWLKKNAPLVDEIRRRSVHLAAPYSVGLTTGPGPEDSANHLWLVDSGQLPAEIPIDDVFDELRKALSAIKSHVQTSTTPGHFEEIIPFSI